MPVSFLGLMTTKWLHSVVKAMDVLHWDCQSLKDQLQLNYPTVNEIRTSVQGYQGVALFLVLKRIRQRTFFVHFTSSGLHQHLQTTYTVLGMFQTLKCTTSLHLTTLVWNGSALLLTTCHKLPGASKYSPR